MSLPQLSIDMRNKLIDKILGNYGSDELFNEILKLDVYEICLQTLKDLDDGQLINIITDGEI